MIEARLRNPVASDRSKADDRVEAVVISPLLSNGRIAVPAGSIVHGVVTKAAALGFGFRRGQAELALRFDTLETQAGRWPIVTRVAQIDAARERVDELGQAQGISPVVSVSSALGSYAWRLVFLEPVTGSIVWGVKFAFAPAPDPEIRLPAGAEFFLELLNPLSIPDTQDAIEPELSSPELARLGELLSNLGHWRVKQRSGAWGDRINFLAVGGPESLERAFAAAGWAKAETRSARSVARSYYAIVERRGYQTAPMAPLTWSGAEPTLAYQKTLNTFAKRHHIRLWRLDARHDGLPVWVGSATDDVAIEFSRASKRWSHRIDPEIDNERTKVISDLWFTGCVERSGLIPRPAEAAPAEETPALATDGAIGAVRIGACDAPRRMPMASPNPPPGFGERLKRIAIDLYRTNPVTMVATAFHLTPRAFMARQRPPNYRSRWREQRTERPASVQ